jgi:predicted  nucleic acid-binding Zn-ribbon protein
MVRTRHKPPTLVSMWMLDVFCCALGCVTLLWLLNTREAADQANRAGATLAELDRTRRTLTSDLDDLRGKLAAVTADRDDTAKKLAAATTDLADARQKYAAAAADLTDTRAKLDSTTTDLSEATKKLTATATDRDETAKRLAAAAARSKELAADLARKADDAAALSAKLADTTRSADDLAKLLRAKDADRDALEGKLRAALREAKDASADKAASKRTGDELAAAARDLQSRLNEASATIIDLQGQKAKLADKYDKLRSDADNRFAGIALTGKRVVFVVDTSGSMKRLDPNTPAPAKWPTVVDTLGKVMRSLPGLEKFQVVAFAEKAKVVVGADGWVDFKGEPSILQATAALTAIDPDGGTNMHDALDLAFRRRADGLDTVYLFSDGLPTSGPGLTPAQEKLSAAEQTDLLARHVRRSLLADWNKSDGAKGRVRVNAVGFFFESPEVGAFLWALARENDGSFVGMSRP